MMTDSGHRSIQEGSVSSSLGVQARAALSLPLGQRSLLWQVLSPALVILSLIFALAAQLRFWLSQRSWIRQRRRATLESWRSQGLVSIISVGNLVAGGSGKSPLVRVLVRAALHQGFSVVVASRGYGARRGAWGLYSVGAAQQTGLDSLLNEDLADELRELADEAEAWLQGRAPGGQLLIAQDPRRTNGLALALKALSQKKGPRQSVVAILDDGLQHHACPRDLDLCVWPAEESFFAPRFSLPFGIYREGFGRSWLNRAASRCGVHVVNLGVLPRAQDVLDMTKRLESFVPRVASAHPPVVLGMASRLVFLEFGGKDQDLRWLDGGALGRRATVVTGIASPDRFVNAVVALWSQAGGKSSDVQVVNLGDHAAFDAGKVSVAFGSSLAQPDQERSLLFLTGKDWGRWRLDQSFQQFAATFRVVVARLEVTLFPWSVAATEQDFGSVRLDDIMQESSTQVVACDVLKMAQQCRIQDL
jgi:tetraacyldisaccharide-1-P 4'-kinase